MSIVPPIPQKAWLRPIGFLLDDGNTGTLTAVSLNIRPEDLTRTEPGRMTVQQTLGGAWLDSFGPGIATISIAGHTGWRGGILVDGFEQFLLLRDTVFTQWHAARDAAVQAGKNPDVVKLIFIDTLNVNVATVAPNPMVLKRNKARPLLYMYQITMTVLEDGIAGTPLGALADLLEILELGQIGLDTMMGILGSLSGDSAAMLDQTFVAGADLLSVSQSVFIAAQTAITSGAGAISSQTSQTVGFAKAIATVGRNAFYTYIANTTLTGDQAFWAQRVAGILDDAACLFSNAFVKRTPFPDLSGLYGASNCSSTNGGSPVSPFTDENTFEELTPPFASTFAVSTDAQNSITALTNTDPVLNPIPMQDLTAHISAIKSGVAQQ